MNDSDTARTPDGTPKTAVAKVATPPLDEFLTSAKPPPPRAYLNAARRTPPVQLSEARFGELNALLDSNRGALLRLEALLAELVDEHGAVQRDASRLAEEFIGRHIESTRAWTRIDPALGAAGVRDAMVVLIRSDSDNDNRKKREIAVCFLLWIARLRGIVEADVFVDLVTEAFPQPTRKKPTSSHQPTSDLSAILAPVLHKRQLREPLIATIVHARRERARLESQVTAGTAEIERQRQEASDQREAIRRLEERIGKLNETIVEKDHRIVQLERDVADHKAIARQSEKRIRGRFNGLLRSELHPLIRDIHDSATMEPVRTHVILDRVETAEKLIERETKWLESSD